MESNTNNTVTTSTLKKCSVCGDKAFGYNFNAVTCESCKAFFRRNALAKKSLHCSFHQNCEINVVTRRFCQKCRLQKCLDIGMKVDHIMSEEDKQLKRRKIQKNREIRQKRPLTKKIHEGEQGEDKEKKVNEIPALDVRDVLPEGVVSTPPLPPPPPPTSHHLAPMLSMEPNASEMSAEQMVDYILLDPEKASQAINKLMRNSTEALNTLEKIIHSQKDALRLIAHLINYPGHGLKIISKIMNSPFDALTVFAKFISSPTDALEIISKVVNSPEDVLQFTKNLMESPQNAMDIMDKFMNSPAEALRLINQLFNESNESSSSSQLNDEMMMNSNSIGLDSITQSNDASLSKKETTRISNHFNDDEQQSPKRRGRRTSSPSIEMETSRANISSSLENNPVPIDDTNFDIKAFMQNTLTENAIHGPANIGGTSLDAVLTEVIRIEYQTFNNLSIPRDGQTEEKVEGEQEQESIGDSRRPSCGQNTNVHGRHNGGNTPPPPPNPSRQLNDIELMKLRELKLASEALYLPVDDDLSVLIGDDRIKSEGNDQDPKLLQVVNLTAVAIKRLIKMAKKITAFREMCQEDQVALLKGGCTEMMILRSVITYDYDRNAWKIPHIKADMSDIRAEVLKLAKGNVYEEHLKFISSFDERWRMDENIILIMCAIVLFTPTRPCIIHSDVIQLEQNSYYYLLRRYLESIYIGCEAKSAFIKLFQKISDLSRLNQFIIGVYLNVNPSQVEPLLREILDLKNH